MGIQSNSIRDLPVILKESEKYLIQSAESEYFYKYFLTKNCFETEEKRLKYHYMVLKHLSDDSCSIVDYVNKKLSGELDAEYRRRKIMQKIDRVEFTWECSDMYDDTDCCEWKSIEW